MTFARKTLTAALVALTIGVTVLASSAPASARGFHRGGWHHGYGPAFGLGLGALALGAVAASSYYGDCYITRRAVVNRFGDVIGTRRVRVCN